MVGEGGVGDTCTVGERLDMFLVLFTAGKRGGLLFVSYIVNSLAVANEEEFHGWKWEMAVGGLQPWALAGKTQSQYGTLCLI